VTTDRAQGTPGQSVSYVVTLRNNGPSDLPAVTLVATLPAGVTFTSANSAQGDAQHDASARTVTLAVLALGAGQEAVINIQAQIPADAQAGSLAAINVSVLESGVVCGHATATTTITPTGIPVTGGGPGLREVQLMLLAGLTGALAALWSGRQLALRAAAVRTRNRRQ
jgi:uncharacterized repeat protein (TIGR01451 family)